MKNNQFTYWTTQELKDWVEKFNLHPLLTINNVNTYLQALKELGRRVNKRVILKGVINYKKGDKYEEY